MAPNTATVTGPAYDGRGNLLADGEMIFVRGRWDQSNGSLIVHGQESVAVEAGNWSIDLVCTDGDRGELISASYIYPDHRSGKPISMSLGVFALPFPGTYPLGGIIGAEDHPPSTQTDALAAALAAKAAAEAAAEGSISAAGQAAGSAAAAAASEISAQNSSAAAGIASGRLIVNTFAELATVFGYTSAGGRRTVAAEDIASVLESGARYRVLTAGSPLPHLDYTSSGGVLFEVLTCDSGHYNPVHFGVESAAQYQAMLDVLPEKCAIWNPAGWDPEFEDNVLLEYAMTMDGPATFKFTAGIAQKGAFVALASHIRILCLDVDNVNELQSQTGGRNYGLEVVADFFTGQNITTRGFQNGIAVRASGEYHNIMLSHIRLHDCIGAGGGPGSMSSLGEDRGDGIIIWGAIATVSDAIAYVKDGQDCRVAFHTESLTDYIVTPAPHSDAMVSFIGCEAYGNGTGKWRRGCVNEGMAASLFVGCIVADVSWWAFCFPQSAQGSTMTGCTSIWTATAADTQGASWNPVRCPFMFYGRAKADTMTDMTVCFMPGTTAAAVLTFQGPDAETKPEMCSVRGLKAYLHDPEGDAVSITSAAIYFNNHVGHVSVKDFHIKLPMYRGAWANNANAGGEIYISDGELDGISPLLSTQQGIQLVGAVERHVKDLIVSNFAGDGTQVSGATGGEVDNCAFKNCGHGVNCFGSMIEVIHSKFSNISGQRILNTLAANRHNVRENQGQTLFASFAVDLPSIASKGVYTDPVGYDMPGLRAGDFIQVSPTTAGDLADLILSGKCLSNDKFTPTAANLRDVSVNLAAIGLRVKAEKFGDLT